jgi:hypothetical protein
MSNKQSSLWRAIVELLPANQQVQVGTNFLPKVMKTAWLYLAGLIAVTGLYYLLSGLDQGIDVLIQAGEYFWPAVFSIAAVFCGAMFLWYSGRLLSYVKQQREFDVYGRNVYDGTAIPTLYHRHLPRLIAFNLFVVVQMAIFKLPNIDPFSGWFALFLFIGHNTFYFVFTEWVERRIDFIKNRNAQNNDPALEVDASKQQRARRILTTLFSSWLIFALGYIAFLFVRFFQAFNRPFETANRSDDPLRYTYWLMLVAMVIFLLEMLSSFLVVWRRRNFGKRRLSFGAQRFSDFLKWVRVSDKHIKNESGDFGYFFIVSLVGLSIYFFTMWSIWWANGMGPLAFAVIALTILTSTANVISTISIRLSVNLFVILFIVSFLTGLIFDPYEIRLEPTTDKKKAYDTRPDAATYLKRWFDHPERKRLIQQAVAARDSFPVYIVLSNGGASRAGSWTTRVLSHLQDESVRIDATNQFADHIICLAGASGGTVGNSAFYSLLRARQANPKDTINFSNQTDEFFNTDFLTYTLAHLLGPDLFRHVMPLWVGGDDRAAALEEVMTHGPDKTIVNGYFDMPMSKVFDTTGALPIYFINTTQVDNGMPGVISSVKLDSNWLRSDVLALVDKVGAADGGMNIRLSTASVLSSRFPYVSPAGKVFDRYFVDGGYFDNSGAGTVYEFMRDLEAFFKTDTALYASIKLNILQITNSEQDLKSSGSIHPLANDMAAPLLTLAGMQGASTKVGTGILKTYFQKNFNKNEDGFIIYSLYEKGYFDRKNEYEEGYPMSWVISEYQSNRTKGALARENGEHLGKFYFAGKQ